MSEKAPPKSAMGDIIGSTRQRLDQPGSPTDRLKNLVAATAVSTPQPAPVRETPPAALPANYFAQVSGTAAMTPKRKPQRGPARSIHISMRMSPPERDRLVTWCDDRNLSLPDGIMALLALAEGQQP
jgi:hypothetical protein